MSAAVAWIISVISAAIAAAVIKNLAGQSRMAVLVQYLAGIYLVLTVMNPVLKLELPDMERWIADFRYEGCRAASEGEQMAETITHRFIKDSIAAYILDKAASLGAEPDVEVKVDAAGIPVSVTLRGKVAPAVRANLMQMMETELGIRRDQQHWIE